MWMRRCARGEEMCRATSSKRCRHLKCAECGGHWLAAKDFSILRDLRRRFGFVPFSLGRRTDAILYPACRDKEPITPILTVRLWLWRNIWTHARHAQMVSRSQPNARSPHWEK